ncbi:NGLY1 [Symbiodinium sp. CCMP2456]|nr:NGLY1 [Symbiodinium sp. CCMP2456]
MEALLGTTLLHGTSQVATSSLQGGVVALYFSAGWCPPCKGFTPQFRKVYEHAKSKNRALDVVFVSSDRDEISFREYFAKMPWHALPFADRQRQQQLSAHFGIRGIPSVVLLNSSGQLLDASARGKVMEPGFVLSLPRSIDLASAALPEPSGALQLQLRYKGCEYDIECEPSEGWEMLRMQIYSMIDVPSEQLKLFGLGLDKGQLDESVPLPRALARGIAAQKNSGLQLAKVPLEARRASSSHDDDKPGQRHHTGTLDSASAWCSKREDCSPWYQLDLGEVGNVAGVLLAARVDCGQWVTRFRVELADSEDGPWSAADDGREFDGPSYALPVRAVFQNGSQLARFVRILPLSHRNHCSLRADVLLATGEPDKPPVIVALGNFSAGDPFESETPEVPMDAMMEEQHLAMLQAKLSSLPPKLQNQVGSLATVQGYEMKSLQRQALDEIPVLGLDAAVNPSESYEISFMRMLVRWFKHEFFSWTNAPRCEHCGSTETKTVGRADPTPEEKHFKANTVELAECSKCGGQTRFPRYNDPAKLLQTRTGRCGEWANCFTLVCRSLGYEARHVHDWTDHVWTEVFSDSKQRWLHVDSCEAALDSPLMYEKGWGKKLTYCIGFARDHVVDVTRRYTQSFEELLPRRTQCAEEELKKAVSAIDEFALDRSLVPYPETAAAARRALLSARADAEAQETTHVATKAEEVGRTSGDAAWRAQRGELGANDAAKQKALDCSETGLEQAGTSRPSTGYKGAEDAQAALRARVAKLMATGLSANDALLKVLEEAKQKA